MSATAGSRTCRLLLLPDSLTDCALPIHPDRVTDIITRNEMHSGIVTISRPTIVFAASAPVSESLLHDKSAVIHLRNENADGDFRPQKESRYKPSPHSRRCHNEKERTRRSRMKRSCQMLRCLVPGLEDKTDKASVLEHAVNYLMHLTQCPLNKCDDYQMQNTDSMVTRVQLLRSCDQSRSSDESEDDHNSVYLQVVPEETSGLAAAELLLQLQNQQIDPLLPKSEH